MSNIFKLCPTHFSRGVKKFSRGGFAPLLSPGYGPVCIICIKFFKPQQNLGGTAAECPRGYTPGYCNSDMKKSVQKIQKDKKFVKISFYSDRVKKWPNVFFHGQRTSKMAKFFEIGHEMANLATLFNSHMRQNAYFGKMKWTFVVRLLLNNKDQYQNNPLASFATCICRQWSGFSELQAHHCKIPEQLTRLLCRVSVTSANKTAIAKIKSIKLLTSGFLENFGS